MQTFLQIYLPKFKNIVTKSKLKYTDRECVHHPGRATRTITAAVQDEKRRRSPLVLGGLEIDIRMAVF